ncbi:uncharacterized protein [Halyomorpha halys]|uniref:uncharacterized protein n=1 Tax=Halyomorpha halys TaxID=286706 RepID=UPI0006D5023E|nr:uncharacterized protein LOC106689427 [Halyomorpha halys]
MAGLLLQKLALKRAAKFLKSNPKECTYAYGYSPGCVTKRYFHVSSSLFKEKEKKETGKCVEKCSKKQREVQTALSDSQNRYLQPRTPILTGHKFTMSPPKVEPYVDVYIEEACRIRQECRELREGGGKKKK